MSLHLPVSPWRRLLVALGLLVNAAFAVTPVAPEVPLADAKVLAQRAADTLRPGTRLVDTRLYRGLEEEPKVWALEFHDPVTDEPVTVLAGATRELPPIVMAWHGLPWHRDPDRLQAARSAFEEKYGAKPAADWSDFRWSGALDLWVAQPDRAGAPAFFNLVDRAAITEETIARTAASRGRIVVNSAGIPSRAAAAPLAPTADYIAALWRGADEVLRNPAPAVVAAGQPPRAAVPQYGATTYIRNVPYLNQGTTPDCGIVSMMDILLYYDRNGFPSLVDENDLNGLRNRLRTLMLWTTNGTYMADNLNGTITYLQERGATGFQLTYHARANNRGTTSTDMSFAQVTSELNAGRPVQLHLYGYERANGTDDNYGYHFVTAVGYTTQAIPGGAAAQWVIVNDNWKGSFTNPYQDVSEPYIDYSQVGAFIKFIPPAAAPVQASVISFDAPTTGSTVASGSATNVIARVNTASGVTVRSVEFKVAGVTLRTATSADAGSGTSSSAQGARYTAAWTPATAGPVTLSATATDSLNRTVTVSSTVNVTTTNAPPTIGWSSPQYDNAQLLTNNPSDLSVVVADSDGSVASVDFVLVGTSAVTLGRAVPGGGTFTTLRNQQFTTPGTYTLRAIATDNRGATASADRRIQVVAAAAQTNDAYAAFATIPPDGGVVATSSSHATKEAGEPNHADNAGGKSLWWRWTPRVSGAAVITTRGSSFDTLLAVYTGATNGGLAVVASSDDEEGSVTSRVAFTAQAGATYAIAVDGYKSPSGNDATAASGNVVLTALSSATASTNDNFASGAALAGATAEVVGNSIAATREAGEPNHSDATGGGSLWWKWTAPANGTLSLTTTGSTFDTLLAVYTGGAVGALTRISSDDDSGGDYTSALTTNVVAGATYAIAVDGYAGASGRVRLALTFTGTGTRPVNDSFASRTVLSGATASITAANDSSSKEPGEPNHAGSSGGNSVWWSWTAPGDGDVSLSTEGSSFDTVLAVYTGPTLGSLTLVGADDDSGANSTSTLSFPVRSGTTYQIAVDGYGPATGRIALYLTFAGAGNVSTTDRPRLINVATRGLASSGSSTLIAGFTIGGTSPKPVLVRAIGPTLGTFGVASAMADPVLTLFRDGTRLQANDDWSDSANKAQIVDKSALAGAFALAANSLDAVILTTLQPGSYTAQIGSAVAGGSGVALIEVYDVDTNADAQATGRRLINLSTRGQVGTGGSIMIAGIVVSGPTSRRMLIRGIGPALGGFGVTGALSDPQLVIKAADGVTVVAGNDDWSSQAAANDVIASAQRVGAFPLTAGSYDAALLVTLAPGAYTVQLSGVSNTTGVALLEAYEDP